MATIIGALPVSLLNGTTADAIQVMADFNFIVSQVNANGLARANNLSDIASAASARTNLGLGSAALLNATGLIAVRGFGTVGTFVYTPTAGTVRILVEAQAGGGGSSGIASTTGAQNSAGAAGGGGGWGLLFITAGFSGQNIVVGAAGVAGLAAGPGSGGNGGLSSFMTLSCPGGAGGLSGVSGGGAPPFVVPGAISSVPPTGATIFRPGSAGSPSILQGGLVMGGNGGDSMWGAGGQGGFTNAGTAAGVAADRYGAGGGAPVNSFSQAARAGAAGSQGAVVIYEFAQ